MPGSELITGTNISTLPTLKNDLSYHSFVKYDIFYVTFTFPPIGTPIGIVAQYCEHHNMSYISHSEKIVIIIVLLPQETVMMCVPLPLE